MIFNKKAIKFFTILVLGLIGFYGVNVLAADKTIGEIATSASSSLTALLQLITGGGLGIWWLIDLILIIVGQFKDKEGSCIRMS